MSEYSGNSYAWMIEEQYQEQKRYCPFCDCKNEHLCLICDFPISKLDCEEFEGICYDCFKEQEKIVKLSAHFNQVKGNL